jgi:CBS domain-containing protein
LPVTNTGRLKTEENLMGAKNQSESFSDTQILERSPDRPTNSTRLWVRVADVMQKDVVTIRPDETSVTAAKIMADKTVSSVVVVDNSKVVGILTKTDLLKKGMSTNSNAEELKISQIMSAPAEVISPDLFVLDASNIMKTKQIKRLPVVAHGQLVGIVTKMDIFLAMEDKCRQLKLSLKIIPKIVKKWYKTEAAYRKAAHAWQHKEPKENVIKHLRDAVNQALDTLRVAGEPNPHFDEVHNLFGLLSSSRITAKKALDQTRNVLNFLGNHAPPEAGLWYIEPRADDT